MEEECEKKRGKENNLSEEDRKNLKIAWNKSITIFMKIIINKLV